MCSSVVAIITALNTLSLHQSHCCMEARHCGIFYPVVRVIFVVPNLPPLSSVMPTETQFTEICPSGNTRISCINSAIASSARTWLWYSYVILLGLEQSDL